MRSLLVAILLVMMSLGSGYSVAAQSGAKEETKKAGESAKSAGKEAGSAAKHAGKATAKGAKKGASTAKKAVTGDAHATCVDGTRQAGATEADAAAACTNHGGVAKK